MVVFKKILVPTDFSPASLTALRVAGELAAKFNSEILLTHVMEPPVYPAMTMAGAANLASVHEELSKACAEHLDRLVREETPKGVKVRALRREGRPFFELVAAAKEEKADLIVIATHGYTGFKHFMLGSTAEKVVRGAECPVLTVRAEETDKAT